MKRFVLIWTGLLSLAVLPLSVHAWYTDPKVNTIVAPAAMNQIDHDAMPDGLGGAFVTWAQKMDPTSDVAFDIYIQRIDKTGRPVWAQPVILCDAPDFQGLPKLCSDGAGGAIIAWHDTRAGMNPEFSNAEIYGQRVAGNGEVLWQQNGIVVCDAASWQVYPAIAADGSGGALISWDDGRSGDSQCYAQKVSADGVCLWKWNGVLLANNNFGQTDTKVVCDGEGGAIISWSDLRQLGNFDTYAQRVDKSGSLAWGDQGLPLADCDGDQFYTRLCSDGQGGAIITWVDGRTGEYEFDIYAQRVTHTGQILWPKWGLPVCRAPKSQTTVAIAMDGLGGALFSWEDGRKDNEDTDIYAQRVTANGIALWKENGIEIATCSTAQTHPAIISDGFGGAIVCFQDFYREGTWWNIFAQRIGAEGLPKWKRDGIPVCTAEDTQSDPLPVAGGGPNGFIIFWFDNRSSQYYNIYAQMIDVNGLLGGSEFRMITTDRQGMPVSTFKTADVIRFLTTWSVPAPRLEGAYTADAFVSVHSNGDFRQRSTAYTVKTKLESTRRGK